MKISGLKLDRHRSMASMPRMVVQTNKNLKKVRDNLCNKTREVKSM